MARSAAASSSAKVVVRNKREKKERRRKRGCIGIVNGGGGGIELGNVESKDRVLRWRRRRGCRREEQRHSPAKERVKIRREGYC